MADPSDNGPPLFRPIPRRPFDLSLTTPTPPDEEDRPFAPESPPASGSDLRSFLEARQNTADALSTGATDPDSISRAASMMNLTTSTLFGIYGPTTSPRDRYYDDRDEPSTPWGTGAQTPAKRASVDDETYELMRERSSKLRRGSSHRHGVPSQGAPPVRKVMVSSLLFRAALLFGLGMGYGVLVTRLQSETNIAGFGVDGIMNHDYDWRYLSLWGAAGVVLGGLLPWFDTVWEGNFGSVDVQPSDPQEPPKETRPETDWTLVMRGVGAFVGIVFAIRKLPWASTMQVSLALALANPFLWYLIDRSKPGFLLSTAVGMMGSALLLSLNPQIMPAPTRFPFSGLYDNSTSSPDPQASALGGSAGQGTIETGIWVWSVLFCSCVCFGNIGRRLALNQSAAARGRWAGVK